MRVISGVYWDKGGREVNQDSVMVQQAVTRAGRMTLAVVSDGIGGLWEGEVASGYITERLIENFYGQMAALVGRRRGKKAVARSMLRCLYEINGELNAYGKGKDLKLGATMSLLFLWGKRYLIVHIGDSRIYSYHRGKVKLLTRDHSDGGRGLTRCVGSFPYQAPDILCGRVWGRQGFLLCTDGFYKRLDKEAFRILSPGDIDREEQIGRRLREMGDVAHKRGEKDNMSAVYAVIQ